MNKSSVKSNIAFWFVVLVIATTAFVVFAMGGNKSNLLNFSFDFDLHSFSRSEFVVMKEQAFGEKISDVSVDWVSGRVDILKSDNDEIRVVQKAMNNFPQNELFSYRVNGGKLYIKDERQNRVKIGININNNGTDLEVYLPEKEFNFINISSVSSNITAENLEAKKLTLDTTSGNITFSGKFSDIDINTVSGSVKSSDLNAEKAVFSTTSGDVTVSGDLTELNVDAISGDVEVESSNMLKSTKLNTVSGDITLIIPENEGFTIDFNKVSGKLDSDFAFVTKGDRHIYKDGTFAFKASTVSGDLEILKK